jgi:hypothetical protein
MLREAERTSGDEWRRRESNPRKISIAPTDPLSQFVQVPHSRRTGGQYASGHPFRSDFRQVRKPLGPAAARVRSRPGAARGCR